MESVTSMGSGTGNASVAGFSELLDRLTGAVEPWQLLLAAGILLVLTLVLIGALASRNRKYDDLLEEKEKQEYAVQRVEKEKQQVLTDKESALTQVQAESTRAIKDKDEQMRGRDEQIGRLSTRVEELTRFHDEYNAIPDARAEASRIIREAKDHAYVVSNRTEMEYAEIIEQANREAEAIRLLAQQRLARSHEALKTALARANEIVEEAHATASRIALNGVAYMPAPGLIEAPDETQQAADIEPQADLESADEPLIVSEPEVADEQESTVET